jgi:hypothetical protein
MRQLSLGILVLLIACGGEIGGLGESHGSGRSAPEGVDVLGTGTVDSPDAALEKRWLDDSASLSPVRRLTTRQFAHAVYDLVGVKVDQGSLPFEAQRDGFVTFAALQGVGASDVNTFLQVAERVAAEADLPKLMSCDENDRACVRAFIEDFSLRAFRRPILSEEVELYLELFDLAESEGFELASRTVLQAMLSSPSFLYRSERSGESGRTASLTGYEYAARLAFFLWSSVPDAALMRDAADGRLDTESGRREQIERMLVDSKARRTVRYFHEQWLHLAELASVAPDPDVFPEFNDTLVSDYAEETARYAEHVFFDAENNTFEELLLGDYSMLNDTLGDLYSLSAAQGPFEKTALDGLPRVGILMQGSTMARLSTPSRSQPIYRGDFMLKDVLCRNLKLPDNLNVMLPEPDPNRTFREQLDETTAIGQCNNCHSRINPLGYGLEAFDALGRYRPEENGFPIDTSGSLVGLGDAVGAFRDGPEMMAIIAASETAAECYAEKWFQFALGRARRQDVDRTTFDEIFDRFRSSGFDLQALLVAISEAEAFTTRSLD